MAFPAEIISFEPDGHRSAKPVFPVYRIPIAPWAGDGMAALAGRLGPSPDIRHEVGFGLHPSNTNGR
jgi:hypothetical protein